MTDSEDNSLKDTTVRHVRRVLIVEDTAELGEIIQIALRDAQVMTVLETSGAAALASYHKLEPEIVILDIGLPDMTGWRLLDSIKESQTDLRHPAIIVITAYGDPANRLMGKLQGVYGYLIKPFSLDQIRDLVRALLDEHAGSTQAAK